MPSNEPPEKLGSKNFHYLFCLVLQPSHLEKYAQVKNLFIFRKDRGENLKNIWVATS